MTLRYPGLHSRGSSWLTAVNHGNNRADFDLSLHKHAWSIKKIPLYLKFKNWVIQYQKFARIFRTLKAVDLSFKNFTSLSGGKNKQENFFSKTLASRSTEFNILKFQGNDLGHIFIKCSFRKVNLRPPFRREWRFQ